MLCSRRSGVPFPRSLNDSRNLASLFSHRKRTIDETQATFQTAPSPTKDPYGRPGNVERSVIHLDLLVTHNMSIQKTLKQHN